MSVLIFGRGLISEEAPHGRDFSVLEFEQLLDSAYETSVITEYALRGIEALDEEFEPEHLSAIRWTLAQAVDALAKPEMDWSGAWSREAAQNREPTSKHL